MSITDLVPVPPRINPGLNNPNQATLLALLGSPRSQFTDECKPVTNRRLRGLIETRDVGPFSVTGLRPAVASLQNVLAEVARESAPVATKIGCAGMLCVRLVRGSAHTISSHSWGTAIDLTLNGVLDRRGDNLVQRGMATIAPIFNRHGWFWGAAFGPEDGMHFETSDELLREWSRQGLLGEQSALPMRILTIGDRGPEVASLQKRLNQLGFLLTVDGIFGPGTRAAVAAFQSEHGLLPDGVVGPVTAAAIGRE